VADLVRSRISSLVIRYVEGILDLNDSMMIVKLMIDEFWAHWWFERASPLWFMTWSNNTTAISLPFSAASRWKPEHCEEFLSCVHQTQLEGSTVEWLWVSLRDIVLDSPQMQIKSRNSDNNLWNERVLISVI
jgi:hypothetical protein